MKMILKRLPTEPFTVNLKTFDDFVVSFVLIITYERFTLEDVDFKEM